MGIYTVETTRGRSQTSEAAAKQLVLLLCSLHKGQRKEFLCMSSRYGAKRAAERKGADTGAGQPAAEPVSGIRKERSFFPSFGEEERFRSFRSRRASAQPTAGRPKAGRPEAARGRQRGAGDRQRDGGIDGRRRLTVESPTASTKPIDKAAQQTHTRRPGTGRWACCSPGGWGETYTDAWTARSNARDRARRAAATPRRYGAGPEGCRAARPSHARARAAQRGCKPSVAPA